MGIKSGGDDDQIRLEFRTYLINCGSKHPLLLSRRGSGFNRHVQCVTRASANARFAASARARIPGILMHRKEEDRGVVIENALRSVSVMHVPVNNCNSLDLRITILRIPSGHSNVIEKTEAHCPLSSRMMARWTHRHKRISCFARHHNVYCLTGATGST